MHARPRARPRRPEKKEDEEMSLFFFCIFHAPLLSRSSSEGKTFLPPRLLEMNKFLLLLQTAGRSADEGLGVLPPALGPAQLGCSSRDAKPSQLHRHFGADSKTSRTG